MRKLLVVVDMQNDFIDGSLGTAEAVQIVDNVVEKIGEYDVKDVFATRDTHPENYLETQEGRKLPVVHCVKGTKGWEINEKVAKALGEAEIIDKPTFGSRKLAEKIEKLAEKEELEVTLVGLCTDICVVSNALRLRGWKGSRPDSRVSLDKSAALTDNTDVNTAAPAAQQEEATMKKTLTIEGMMCAHCVAHVEKALNALPGVTASVDLDSKTAVVTGDAGDEALKKAVADAGYQVTDIR